MNNSWEELLQNRFGDWINPEGKIVMQVVRGKDIAKYDFFSVEELTNPKYSVFEMIKKILKNYDEYCGGSEIASKLSNHYDNLLFCLAAVYDCADESDLEIWQQRFNAKFNKK